MTALDAALAPPTAAELAEVRDAVGAAVDAGAGFVAVHLEETGRLFTGAVVGGALVHWNLEPVADRAEAQARAEDHARDFVRTARRMVRAARAPRPAPGGAWH